MRTAALALAAVLLTAAPAPATPIGALDEADLVAVEALALYDETITRHALHAMTEADVLSDVVGHQERSRESFRQLLSPYQRDVQEQLFEITRYPELIAEIVEGGPKSTYELEAIAALYPEEARGATLAAGSGHWKVLARIDALLRDEAAWFEARIAHLPEAKREAFRALVATPELLALLAENTTLAVLLGDAYEREPEAVVAWLATVRHQAEEQGALEAREFAQGVEDNPELAGEIEAATSIYEQETGYSAYQPTVVRHTYVQVRPYSYWVGYPWWYEVSYRSYAPWYYWYPRVSWAFGSFYFGPRLHVSFGVPHGGFWGWYFRRPVHYRHYPRETHHVVQHYDRHRVRHHQGYRPRRHRARGHHTAARVVYHSGRGAERSVRLASRGGHRIAPQRGVKVERRRERAKPRRAERRQISQRERATRIARAEPARRASSPQRRVEAKRRPAPQHRVEAKRRPAPQHRVEQRRSQRPRQEVRRAPRTAEPRHAQANRPRRVQNERAQPKTRQARNQHRKVVKRANARGGGSRRRAR